MKPSVLIKVTNKRNGTVLYRNHKRVRDNTYGYTSDIKDAEILNKNEADECLENLSRYKENWCIEAITKCLKI